MWIISGIGLIGIILTVQNVAGQGINIDDIARQMNVSYKVLTNFAIPNSPHTAVLLKLQNIGATPIPSFGFQCYFCHDNFIFPRLYDQRRGNYYVPPYAAKLVLQYPAMLDFVKGCMYKFTPIGGTPLAPGETREVPFHTEPFSVSKYDSFPNWYCSNGTHTSVIEATKDLSFVEDFDNNLNWFRVQDDIRSVPLQPQDRYFDPDTRKTLTTDECKYNVIPTHRSVTTGTGTLSIDSTWTINYGTDDRLKDVAEQLQRDEEVKLRISNTGATKNIVLAITPITNFPEAQYGTNRMEAYRLQAGGNKVTISAPSVAGIINGIQTFKALYIWDNRMIPVVDIRDGPRFGFRGVSFDIASNFPGLDYLRKFLDVMASYKLNKLILPIYNNEGFRLEIKGIPSEGISDGFSVLHQIGGKRCHDETEKTCLFSQLGSNPTGTGLGSGYLRYNEMAALIREANVRNIEIIPSINTGDSARAAVVALKQHPDPRMRTLLFDPTDETLLYNPRYPQQDSAINPCRNESANFFEFMVKYLKHLYDQGAKVPLKNVMVGSDIVPEQMFTSKHCFPQPLILERNPGARTQIVELKVRYIEKLNQILQKYGINQMTGIDDAFTGIFDGQGITPNTIFDKRRRFNGDVIAVHNRYELLPMRAGDEHLWNRGAMFTELDYKVLHSPPILGFDYAIEQDPDLPGDYDRVLRNVSLPRLFRFVPDSHCCNIPNPMPNDCVLQRDCVQPTKPENFIGTLGKIDTHKLRNPEEWNKLLFPRLLIFAERSWHKAPWEDTFGAHREEINMTVGTARTVFNTPEWTAVKADERKILGCISVKEHARLAYNKKIIPYIEAPGARVSTSGTRRVLAVSAEDDGFIVEILQGGQWKRLPPKSDITASNDETFTLRARHRRLQNLVSKPVVFNVTMDKTPRQTVAEILRNAQIQRERQLAQMRQLRPPFLPGSFPPGFPPGLNPAQAAAGAGGQAGLQGQAGVPGQAGATGAQGATAQAGVPGFPQAGLPAGFPGMVPGMAPGLPGQARLPGQAGAQTAQTATGQAGAAGAQGAQAAQAGLRPGFPGFFPPFLPPGAVQPGFFPPGLPGQTGLQAAQAAAGQGGLQGQQAAAGTAARGLTGAAQLQQRAAAAVPGAGK